MTVSRPVHPNAPRPAPTEASRWEALRLELRQTGEAGKQEWERLFARWGEQWQAFRDEPLTRHLDDAREAVSERVHTSWQTLQARGAHLARDVVARVKAGAEAVEAQLAAPK